VSARDPRPGRRVLAGHGGAGGWGRGSQQGSPRPGQPRYRRGWGVAEGSPGSCPPRTRFGGAPWHPPASPGPSAWPAQQDLQPARAGGDELPGVAGPPALGKADADAVGVAGPLPGEPPAARAPHPLVVEHLGRITRQHLEDGEAAGAGGSQGGRADEDGVLAAVVGPHAAGLPAQQQPPADLAAGAPDGTAPVGCRQLAQAEPAAPRQLAEDVHRRLVHGVEAANAGPVFPVSQFAPVAVLRGAGREAGVWTGESGAVTAGHSHPLPRGVAEPRGRSGQGQGGQGGSGHGEGVRAPQADGCPDGWTRHPRDVRARAPARSVSHRSRCPPARRARPSPGSAVTGVPGKVEPGGQRPGGRRPGRSRGCVRQGTLCASPRAALPPAGSPAPPKITGAAAGGGPGRNPSSCAGPSPPAGSAPQFSALSPAPRPSAGRGGVRQPPGMAAPSYRAGPHRCS